MPNYLPSPQMPQVGTIPQAGFQGGTAPTPYGQLSTYGGTALLGVDPDMLVTNRLATLLRSDNPLLQGARGRAMNYAAARGAGADSASYGYNAEQAMGDILTPLASQEADVYGKTAAANQAALNEAAANKLQANTSTGIAQIGARSALDQLRLRNQYDQEQRLQDRNWQVADQGTQARAQARSQFFGNMESALFSDPSFWRDPEGMMGAFNEYGSNFDAWFNSAFPEYSQMQDQGGVPSGGQP